VDKSSHRVQFSNASLDALCRSTHVAAAVVTLADDVVDAEIALLQAERKQAPYLQQQITKTYVSPLVLE